MGPNSNPGYLVCPRASTRGRSKSSTELANLGSNSPTRRKISYENDRTAHSVRIFDGTYKKSGGNA
eukprot:29491-Pelagococcus_subviridis.AAC.1